MTTLRPDLPLVRAAQLKLKLDSSGHLHVWKGGSSVDLGGHGLVILDQFRSSSSLREAMEALKARAKGARDLMELSSAIVSLHGIGALVPKGSEAELSETQGGYDSTSIQTAMLNDKLRTKAFLEAIAAEVRPGDVVVDLGSGTGILSLAAARAGARKVYAIEASSMSGVIREMARANGYEGVIEVIQGWSTQVSLPELGDVLVSEMVGNEPLGERILELTLDARKRLLKPDARLIPKGLRVQASGFSLPASVAERRFFREQNLTKWGQYYGFDFRPLGESAPSTAWFYRNPEDTRDWPALTSASILGELDLASMEETVVSLTGALSVTHSGELDALVLGFELLFEEGRSLLVAPGEAAEPSHWRLPVRYRSLPISVEEGDELEVSYDYRGRGAKLSFDKK